MKMSTLVSTFATWTAQAEPVAMPKPAVVEQPKRTPSLPQAPEPPAIDSTTPLTETAETRPHEHPAQSNVVPFARPTRQLPRSAEVGGHGARIRRSRRWYDGNTSWS